MRGRPSHAGSRLLGRVAPPPPRAVFAAAAVAAVVLPLRAVPAQPANVFEAEPPDALQAEAEEPGLVGEGWQDDAAELGVFLPGDRHGERMLDRGRRLIAEARWSDAAAVLDELLAGEKDAFAAAPGNGTTRGSIRTQAAALVSRLPRPGREAYERLFGGRAERQLAAAIAADDEAGIVAVARRWLQTPAGIQAALIAAVRALEAGQPLAAIAWLDRLATAAAAADLEPTLSVMRAAARAAAGDDAAADRLLVEAARRGRSGVRLAGRDTALELGSGDARAWLERHAAIAGSQPAAGREWRQFRGTPARNGTVEASRPLLVPRYRVPLVPHPQEGRRLEKLRLAAAAEGEPLLPAGSPVAVGDQIVVQTPLGILAIDFVTGRRVWLASALAGTADVAEAGREQLPAVFSDATSGNLASDGTLVFAVEFPPRALTPPQPGFTGMLRVPGAGDLDEEGNSLSAYELRTGRVRWRLEGRSEAGADEQADGYRWHLGPPLVVGDEVFILVEERGEVRLEVRAAADAAVRWTQPLATYDDGEAISAEERHARRLAGLTPALGDGVLVCPLGGGCVVAIDVANRSLLWAHGYPRPAALANLGDLGGFRPDPPAANDGPALLGEPAPVIAGDRVLLAPFDTRLVICLGLADGRPIWRRPRDHRVEIAGVVDGRLLLVDAEGAEAIALDTGRRLWQRGLGNGVRPSGRCILTPRSLLVPCDAPAVVELAVADGSIIGRGVARGGGIPGSLVAHRGEVISRGVDFLDVFHQEQALDGRIETALRAEPENPWAAYWAGQVALEAGDVAAGLDGLARAAAAPGFRIPPGDLAAAVVRAMEQDFLVAARRWASFPTATSTPPAAAVERMTVDGFLDRKDPAAAWPPLRRLLRAAPEPGWTGPLLRDSADPRLFLAPDRWLESRLARLSAVADESLRRQIDDARGERSAAVAGTDLLAEKNAKPEPDADDAWPLGRVEHRDFRGEPDRGSGDGTTELRPVPLAVSTGSPTRAAQAAIDVSGQRLLVTDDLGRPLARPLAVPGLARGFGLQFLAQSAAVEVAAWGRAVFIRSTSGIVAHELGGPEASARPLWNNDELGTETGDAGVRWIGGGGRVARDGAVPLGMRIGEPDDRPRGGGRGMTAVRAGLVVPGRRSVTLLDPATGGVLWRRDRLPEGLEWIGDDEFLCGCTVDGRRSLVLATADGRWLHEWDVPHRRQRVASRGRRFVAVHPQDEPGLAKVAARVRLDLVDPGDREVRLLGLFDGRSRATDTGDGRLAVLAPDGRLTVFDLADGSTVFQRELPAVPSQFERLHVQPWRDRYLVVVGISAEDEPQAADVSPLEPLLFSGAAAAPFSGGVWAVDRTDGRPLWPVPAVIERHCLHTAQPRGLPLLAFCRILQTDGTGQPSLSVLCLDKRTGHAVFRDDRIELRGPAAGGCELVANPADHTVAIGDAGVGGGRLVLAYTGRPIAPQTPFQSRGRPGLPVAGLELIEGSLDEGGRTPPGNP